MTDAIADLLHNVSSGDLGVCVHSREHDWEPLCEEWARAIRLSAPSPADPEGLTPAQAAEFEAWIADHGPGGSGTLRLGAPAPAEGLDVQRLMDAEHHWCVEVEGELALRHPVEAHRRQAEFLLAALALKEPTP